MFCPACGEQVTEGAKFCIRCGNHLESAAPEPGTISGGGTIVSGPGRPETAVHPGEQFADRYRIERELGRGGMGTVYLALDTWAHRPVCLKVILPELVADEALARRFLREGTQARDLRHRNIVAVYDVSRHEDTFFLSMEYVKGTALRDWLRENLRSRREVPLETARRLTGQILDGLGEAHRKGIVHRDLKPENLMYAGDPDSAEVVVKILDFGIARALDSDEQLTMPGATMGTPVYMAPEQETGADAAGPEADLYSAGVILYEIVTGIPPRGRWPLPSEIRPDAPAALDQVLLKALEAHPARRFASVSEFRAALDGIGVRPSEGAAPSAPRLDRHDRLIPMWTQGISKNGRADGSFDLWEHGPASLEAALQALEHLPHVRHAPPEEEYCPPSVGFESGLAISRAMPGDTGEYFVFPHEKYCDLNAARDVVRELYQTMFG